MIILFSFLGSEVIAKLNYNLLVIKLSNVVIQTRDKPLNIRLKNDQVKSLESNFLTIQSQLDDDGLLLYHLGQLAFWQEDYLGTTKYLNPSLNHKSVPLAAIFSGFAYNNRGEIDDAVRVLKEIPGVPNYLIGLALDAEYENNYDTARDLYQLVNLLEPGWLPGESGYWFAYAIGNLEDGSIYNNDFDSSLINAIQHNRDNFRRQLELGVSLYKSQRLDLAKICLERAIILNSNSRWPHYYLGLVYYREERYLLAIDKFEDTLKLSSSFGLAHLYIARSLEKLGRDEDASYHYSLADKLLQDGNSIDN